MLLPLASHYARAQEVAGLMIHILVDEMKLQSPQRFQMTEHGQFTWLFAVMDDLNLGGSMNKYISNATLHRLSTALDGLPVKLSNHSGLRYAVMLSDRPRVPQQTVFPDGPIEHDVIPLGAGLAGPVHAHAKQIVNAIVVGAQDSGKSMALRALAHSARMHGSQLYLADAVVHTFNPDVWNRVSAFPVAQHTGQFLKMLEHVSEEINRRSRLFRAAAERGIPPEDIEAYNKLTGQVLPRVWVIADEANSFLASKAIQDRLADPARIGRKYGIHVVLAGHDWHEYTVNRGLTSFFETRLCMRTSNNTTGKIVLDDHIRGQRTMKFVQPGRAVLKLRGQFRDVQLYYLAPERERDWFAEIQPTAQNVQMTLEQAAAQMANDPHFIIPMDVPDVDEIVQLAEAIRPKWQPGMSKNQVSLLFGKPYGGSSWTPKVNKIVDYLTSTTTSKQSKNGGSGPESTPLAA